MARTKKRYLYIATESTYGTDPDANDDGSEYLWVPTLSVGDIRDQKAGLPTNYATGRNFPTAPIAGPDGGEFDFEIPLIGLSTAAGDGVDASTVTDDWLDRILTHVYGTQTTTIGEGVGAGSTTSSIVLDTDAYGVQHLMPIWESGLPTTGARTQWCLISADPGTGTYTVVPTIDAAPTTTGVAYGTKYYTFDDDGGATLSFYYLQDDVPYTLLGCRATAASITAEAGKMIRMRMTFRFDSQTQETKSGSLPAVGAAPSNTPLVGLLSPVWFNGTKYETSKIEIDLGLNPAVRAATAGTNGRGEDENIGPVPSVSIEPLYTNAILNLKRNQTAGRLLVQLGGGVFASSILNAMACHAQEAVAMEVSRVDENGRQRAGIMFQVSDPVTSSGAAARVWQHVRA